MENVKQPLVSLIIVSSEYDVEECLKSLLEQTYKNIEIILSFYNLKSKDTIRLEKYIDNSRVKILPELVNNQSEAMNNGITFSNGELLSFFTKDNLIYENYTEHLISLLYDNYADIAFVNLYNSPISSEKEKISHMSRKNALSRIAEDFHKQLVVPFGKLYKSELFKGLSYPSDKILYEEYITYKLFYRAKKAILTSKELMRIRDNPVYKFGSDILRDIELVDAYYNRAKFVSKNCNGEVVEKTNKQLFIVYTKIFRDKNLFRHPNEKNLFKKQYQLLKSDIRQGNYKYKLRYEISFISPVIGEWIQTVSKKIIVIIKKKRSKYRRTKKRRSLIASVAKSARNIFLFGVPWHGNMGDQAQTFCIRNWMIENYPSYKIHEISYYDFDDKLPVAIGKNLNKEDLIVLHSGYHLTDMYFEQSAYKKVVDIFQDNKIFIFPQTVNYIDRKEAEITASIFNNHGNVSLLCRDELSYERAQEIFTECRLKLCPDIVTSLIGTVTNDKIRENVLFCIRSDRESFYTPELLKPLISSIEGSAKVFITDTSVSDNVDYLSKHREERLLKLLKKYAGYKLIITDRYHGTIFSLIVGTPVIVLKTADHKLSSGVKWFPPTFDKHVFYANDLKEAESIALEMLRDYEWPGDLPEYFNSRYYLKLKDWFETGDKQQKGEVVK